MSITFIALDHQEAFRDVFGMTTEQKAAYLDGLLAGAMGVAPERLPEGPARAGADRGIESRSRYEASIQQRREAGARSAQARRERTGNAVPNVASNAVPNENPNGVPNGVPNESPTPFRTESERRSERDPNGVPNDASTAFRTREEKRREEPPPTPQGGEGGDLELGDIERQAIAAWDGVAAPAGLPPVGAWNQRRRKAMRALSSEAAASGVMPFLELWRRAVEAVSTDAWALGQRVNVDYLLRPDRFQRHLDAWAPPPTKEPRHAYKAPEEPLTAEQRAANRKALLEAIPRAVAS